MDAINAGGKGKIQPPIRFQKDRDRLWRGIKDGTLSVIGTDSLTYTASFKERGDFWDCRVGVNNQVADTLALIFDEAVNRRGIDLVTVARALSENAARMYGIYPKKGVIAVGSAADRWWSIRRLKSRSASIATAGALTIRYGKAARSEAFR